MRSNIKGVVGMKRLFFIFIALLFFTAPITASATTVGLWLFDEGAGGTAYDSSSYGNHGALGGEVSGDEPAWVTGKYGSALYFDGVNDWLDCGSSASLDITGDMTIEFWMKPQNWNKDEVEVSYTSILMKGDNPYFSGNEVTYDIGHANSGNTNIKFSYYNDSWVNVVDTSGVTYSDNAWYHMAVVVDTVNDKVRFYRDGNLLSQVSNDFTVNPMSSTVDNPLVMGRFNNSVEWYKGALDEVRFSDVALSKDDLGYAHSFVPEPAVMIMLGSLATGLFGMAGARKRFSKR